MKALPFVAGVSVLGFALVLFVSTFRQTRTHVHRESHGEGDFAIDVPRAWTAADILQSRIEVVRGRLPSGRATYVSLTTAHYGSPPGRYPDVASVRIERPDEIRVVSAEGGWRRTLLHVLHVPPGGSARVITVLGRIERGDITFSAQATVPEGASKADLDLLDRCVRSVRWIGR